MLKQTFEVTEEHLKLLARMNVRWNDRSYKGAPEIDPKRPYGNSAVFEDIHEILTGESIAMIGSKRDDLTEEEVHYYTTLHKETEIALQIVLSTRNFETGKYEAEPYSSQWHKI